MEIGQISNLITNFGSSNANKSTASSGSFTDVLNDAISNAQDTEQAVQAQNAQVLTGETDDLHTPIVEAQKAELALNLAIQIRNKVVSAYNDVMNMQV